MTTSHAKSAKISTSRRPRHNRLRAKKRYVVCLSSKGYEGALKRNKIYIALGRDGAEERGFVRVIDDSGEDYLYEVNRFAEIELPRKIARAIAASA